MNTLKEIQSKIQKKIIYESFVTLYLKFKLIIGITNFYTLARFIET